MTDKRTPISMAYSGLSKLYGESSFKAFFCLKSQASSCFKHQSNQPYKQQVINIAYITCCLCGHLALANYYVFCQFMCLRACVSACLRKLHLTRLKSYKFQRSVRFSPKCQISWTTCFSTVSTAHLGRQFIPGCILARGISPVMVQ